MSTFLILKELAFPLAKIWAKWGVLLFMYLFIHSFFVCVKHTGQSILFPGKPQGIWRRLSIQLWTQLSQISSYKLEHVAEKEVKCSSPVVHSLKETERGRKMLLDTCLEKWRGGSLSSHPQIHAAARGRAISCTSKNALPSHGFIDWAKSKAQWQTWTTYTSLHSRMYLQDPSPKGKQLLLLKWTKKWAFISPSNDLEDSSKNILFPKLIQMSETHQENTYRTFLLQGFRSLVSDPCNFHRPAPQLQDVH